MDRERYEAWAKRSYRWIRDPARDGGLPHHLQLLGIVDADIRGLRQKDFFDEFGNALEGPDEILVFERAQILAHLWVLGAYEFIRMLAQRVTEDPSLATDASIAKIQRAKALFTRIRVPLAKLEPAGRHKDIDYAVPLPGVGSRGLGWRVNERLTVYQEDLSDTFFALLSVLRHRTGSNRQTSRP